MLDKKYELNKVYIGYIVAVVKIDCSSSDKNTVTFCKIKESIFLKKKKNKYIDLKTDIEYYTIDYGMEYGDIVFNDQNKVNIAEYFIENNISYNRKMTLNEIENLIPDNHIKNEETNSFSFQRKRR